MNMHNFSEEEIQQLKQKFPGFQCICDICDCGHCKRKHDCKKQKRQRKNQNEPFPLTDYQATFASHRTRPRSSKRPPPTPMEMNPPPMEFSTNQRSAFKPVQQERLMPIKREDEYNPPKAPFEGSTFYSREFVPKADQVETTTRRPGSHSNRKYDTGKFEGQTTNQEKFKHWVAKPSLTFRELPSFAGSILYPEPKSKVPQSTIQSSYVGTQAPRVHAFKLADPTIKMEGDHDFSTTNSQVFRPREDTIERTKSLKREPQMARFPRGKFQFDTQSRSDFKEWNAREARAKQAIPAPETIRLRYDDDLKFDTEQRRNYKGVDINDFPAPKPIIKDNNIYLPPSVKFETNTNQKLDYPQHEVKFAPKARMQPTKSAEQQPRLDDVTMNNHFYKKWNVQPRERFGDFHEGHKYVPPMDKFNVVSTNRDTYNNTKADPVINYKPKNVAVTREGKIDFDTVNSMTYTEPKAPLCQAKAFLMEMEQKRKAGTMKISSAPKQQRTVTFSGTSIGARA